MISILRTMYVAGVNSEGLAEIANEKKQWLISATLTRSKRTGVPHKWLHKWLENRDVLYDPGFSVNGRVTFEEYCQMLRDFARPQDKYLQYDIVNNAKETERYLFEMREMGFDPIPILQPNGNVELHKEPVLAIGALVAMSKRGRVNYLDSLFCGDNAPTGEVHLLGMVQDFWFRRYKAKTGDSTTWIQLAVNSDKTHQELLKLYGERHIEFKGADSIQQSLF
jgi:hypothetical protein